MSSNRFVPAEAAERRRGSRRGSRRDFPAILSQIVSLVEPLVPHSDAVTRRLGYPFPNENHCNGCQITRLSARTRGPDPGMRPHPGRCHIAAARIELSNVLPEPTATVSSNRPVPKSLVKRCLNRVLNVVARVAPGSKSLRPFLHRVRGVKIGRDVFIGDDVFIDGEYPEMVEIHDGAAISMRAMIIAHSKGPGKVIIEKEAFIGPQAIILCNGGKELCIGEGAIISAGCVISRNVPPRLVVVPAPTQIAGEATISLATARTIEEFWSGLKPLRARTPTHRSAPTVPTAPSPQEIPGQPSS